MSLNEINVDPVDKFTLLHIAAGVAMRKMGLSLTQTIALSIAWEIAEPRLKAAVPGMFPYPSPDSPANVFFDNVAVMFGWSMAGNLT